MSSRFLYETYFEKSILEANKYSSSILYSGKKASNLDGFNMVYSLSYMWLATFSIGTIVTLIVGILVSLMTSCDTNEVDKSFLVV